VLLILSRAEMGGPWDMCVTESFKVEGASARHERECGRGRGGGGRGGYRGFKVGRRGSGMRLIPMDDVYVYLYSVYASSRTQRNVITLAASSSLAFVERTTVAKSRPSKAETNALGYFRRSIPNISN